MNPNDIISICVLGFLYTGAKIDLETGNLEKEHFPSIFRNGNFVNIAIVNLRGDSIL